VWGDVKFPSSGKGSPAVPTSTLRKKVGSRVKTIDHDAFRTSKLCCRCHKDLKPLVDPKTLSESYSLRVCSNNACIRTVWDRNVSAAINILHIFLEFANGRERPGPFQRSNPPSTEVKQTRKRRRELPDFFYTTSFAVCKRTPKRLKPLFPLMEGAVSAAASVDGKSGFTRSFH
jgi:hypothetical protein